MEQSFADGRARLGVIYPASGTADMEFYQLCPPGVSVHVTRSSVPNGGGVTLADVLEVAEGRQFEQLAGDLATVYPNAIAWMCTSGSFSRGAAGDAELRSRMSEYGNCPATSTSTAMVTALQALGVRRVGVASPYAEPVRERLVAYLAEHGITTVTCLGLDLLKDWEISKVTPGELCALVRAADAPNAEAVFLAETCLVLSPYAEALGAELGKPVFSANMVTMWHALRLAGIDDPLPGFGALANLHPAREPPA